MTPTPAPASDDNTPEYLEAIGEILSALAWPLVVLLLLLLLMFTKSGRQFVERTLSRFRRLKGPGFELELTEAGATFVHDLTEEQFRSFRARVRSEFDRQVGIYAIEERVQRVVTDYIMPALGENPPADLRCTIHVPDILFTQTLYQLIDYYPKDTGKRGRTFPTRFGIVGRAWRLREPQVNSDVPTAPEQLVAEWGMTRRDAMAAGSGRRSFAAIPLQDANTVDVALVYLDTEQPHAFGEARGPAHADERANELIQAIEAGATATGLTESVATMIQEMRRRGPAIKVYEVGE